jgi:hypothetical protein
MVGPRSYAQGISRTFPETGKTVKGRFLEYWNQNGGLPQQGYPISEEMQETSDTDGKTYTVQYFERAVFEHHPDQPQPFDVLLSLLGVFYYNEKYGGNAPNQKVSTDNPRRFTETGHTIGGVFRQYWESHGGLAQQGYPISDEFQEIDKDGNPRTVQYFQRAVFEYHQEFAGTSNEVLLSLLGAFFYDRKYGGQPPTPSGSSVTAPGWTHVLAVTNDVVLFYDAGDGEATTARLNTDGTYTMLKEHLSLGVRWTHIVAGPSSLVLLYGADDGALASGRINSDGTYQLLQQYSHQKGATHLMVDGTGKVFTYDSVSGAARFGLLNANGEYEDKNSYFMDKGYSHVVSTGKYGVTLMYMQQGGHAVAYKFDENGIRTLLKSYPNGAFCTCWTHIVSDNLGRMLFYDINSGQGGTGQLIITGLYVQKQAYPTGAFSTNWTQITVAPNGVWLFYNSNTGQMGTGRLDENLAYGELKSYQPGQ